MPIGSISSASTPEASCARAWDRAAKASWSSRLTSTSPVLQPSVRAPMAWSLNTSHKPSKAIESTRAVLPYLKPARAPGSRCGAWVIDSIPPATTTSHSPARIS